MKGKVKRNTKRNIKGNIKGNREEIREFIREHSTLFWYTPEDKKEEISHELLVEMIFNYGSLEDIKRLIEIMGVERITEVFYGLQGRKKLNYFPEIYNYFSLLVKRYASRSI